MNTKPLATLLTKALTAILLSSLILSIMPVIPAYAAAITVNSNADTVAVNGLCTLREAIQNANNDAATNADCVAGSGSDTISFNAGMTITLASTLPAIASNLTLDGGNNVTLNGAGLVEIAIVNAGAAATFQNITLRDGYFNGNGGGIFNSGNLTVNNVTFNNNRTITTGTTNGGAIYHTTGTLSISNSTFTSNRAMQNGGAIYISDGAGTMSITNSTFLNQNNASINNGGAIYLNTGTLVVTGSTFQGNAASADGGAIYVNNGTLTLNNDTFTSNSGRGGAVLYNGPTLLTVTESTFTGNQTVSVASDGGAINLLNPGSSALIVGSTFTSNAAQDDGGAIMNNGSPFTVTSSTFVSNSAGNAGAGATTGPEGGAIRNTANGTNSKITLSTFINNSITLPADYVLHGGAVANNGTLTIANATFSGNTISQTTATGTTDSLGGAIYAATSTTVHNSTFSGNSVSEIGTGLASGGSVYSAAGAMTIANSILASGTENGVAGNCGGAFTSPSNNVDFNGGDCGFTITGNPALGGLTGSPAYFPLGAGSSALDAGSNAICANAATTNNQSQNGVTRPQNGTCDIGSYELPNTAPVVSTPLEDINVLEDATNTVFSLFPNFADAESTDAQLTYTVTANTNPSLFTSVSIADPTNFTLDYAADANGTADITIRATDPGGLFVEDTFTVTVTAVNDAPSFVLGGNQIVLEDAGPQSVLKWAIAISAGPVDEAGQILTFNVTNDNNALFSVQPAIAADGTLTYTPAADANGVATVTVSLQDNGGTANGGVDTYTPLANTFTIMVTAVNDMPDFTGFNPPAVNEDAGPQSTSIISTTDLGPADEDASQSVLAYIVSNSTCGTLLSAGPTVDTSGVLTYTPAASQNGTCTFDLQLQDNGGTANGGIDTSPVHSFTITVNSVNDAPTDISLSNSSIAENNAVNDVIGTLSATDADAGDTFVFALACSVPGADDGSFNISGTNLQASAVYDYETKNIYSICIRVTDQGGAGLSFDKNFTINILDVDEIPPDTTITGNPSNPTNSTSASFTFIGVDNPGGSGVVSFECSLDGSLFTACTSPQTYTGLSDGNHNFQVRAIDGAGNTDLSPASFSWLIDASAPDTTIDSNPANPTSNTSASFAFSGIDAGAGVVGFECLLDGGTFTDCTSPQNYSSLTDGSHTFQVRAIDALGSVDPSPASFTWIVDSTAPDTAITANPTNPSNSTSASFSFTGNDGSGTGVASFECSLDGGMFTSCTSPQSYTGLGDGSHTFDVRAVDAVGNVDPTPASYTWTVDATAPNTIINSNPADPSTSSSASFTFSGDDGTGTGVVSFECSLDGALFTTCTSPQNYSGLADGSHNFQVRAIDVVGNVDPSPASYTWTVDATAPTVTIEQAAAQSDPTSNSPIDFTVVFSETVTGFTAADIDLAASTAGGTLVASISGSGPTYTVSVTGMTISGDVIASIPANAAQDTSGNNSAASTSADNTVAYVDAAPTVTINQAGTQADPTNSSPIDFTIVFSEAVNGFTAGDVSFAGSTVGGTLVASVSGIGPTYTVSVSGMTSNGLVVASIPASMVTDSVGNPNAASTSTDNTVTFDNTLPDTTIDSSPTNPSSSTNAAFTFSSTASDLSGFECKLDSGGFTSCSSPQSYTGLSAGSHTFQVRAVDTSNNVDPTPASFTWIVDLGFPTVSSTTPAANATVAPGLTQLTVTFSEDVKNDGSAAAANNATNYLLVEDGANNTFNTVSCEGGLVSDDAQIAISSATYTNNGGSGPFVATLTVPALQIGTYRLFICGTTSIEDLSGNKLNNGVSDATVTFTVSIAQTATRARALPGTGFAMNQITALPIQPADKAYVPTNLWLEISKLNVKMSIVGVPFKDSAWDVKWLDKNAGWLNGSAYPTWSGNSVLTGHVWDALNKPGPFAELKKLQYGDQIKIHAFGQVFVYEVRTTETITPTDVSTAFKHEEKSWITLLTCEEYKEASQTYSSRRMVRAILVSVSAEK